MSISSILSIARTALLTHQQAVDTASHNIANASTEGFTRQRLELSAMEPLRTPLGTIGRGVTSEGVRRIRDGWLDASFRNESSLLGRFETTRDMVSGLESVLADMGESGLGAGLDALFDAFSDLANDPGSQSARAVVRESAEALVRRFHGAAERLAAAGAEAVERMQSDLGDVNQLAAEIADLNRQITSASAGRSAPDLEDRRDLLIDRLSKLVDIQVVPHQNGGVGIVAGGALLVDGGQHGALELRSLAAGGYGVGLVGASGPVALAGGSLRALSDLTATTLPGLQRQLDDFTRTIVTEVNAVHRTGRTTDGTTGTDFFDASGTTAATVRVAEPIRRSLTGIAAGTTGAPGDGEVALRLAQLRTAAVASANGRTLGEIYTGLVTSVGVLGRSAEQAAISQDTLVANVAAQRSSVSDVSIDEEMVALIKGQQAFAAASKIVVAADEMIQSVLDMV